MMRFVMISRHEPKGFAVTVAQQQVGLLHVAASRCCPLNTSEASRAVQAQGMTDDAVLLSTAKTLSSYLLQSTGGAGEPTADQ